MKCQYYKGERSMCLRKPLFCPWHLCFKHMVSTIINMEVDAVIVKQHLRVHD